MNIYELFSHLSPSQTKKKSVFVKLATMGEKKQWNLILFIKMHTLNESTLWKKELYSAVFSREAAVECTESISPWTIEWGKVFFLITKIWLSLQLYSCSFIFKREAFFVYALPPPDRIFFLSSFLGWKIHRPLSSLVFTMKQKQFFYTKNFFFCKWRFFFCDGK